MVLFGKKIRIGAVEREILESINAGDLLIGFLCSAHSARRMSSIAYKRALARYRAKKAIDSLILKGLARRTGDTLSITEPGRTILDRTIHYVRDSVHQRSWDGKWRVVTYDIPEKFKSLRHQIRGILKRAGFIKLHNSVWVFPHECHELLELIQSDRRISNFVLYGTLEKIESTESLREQFGLAKIEI